MGVLNHAFFRPQAAGYDDLAVLGQRLADGGERLLDRGVDEAAGVDDDEVGAGVIRRGSVALGPQLGENSLRINQGFRAPKRDESYLRYFFQGFLSEPPGGGNPGKLKPVNALRAWFCIWSWNCANIFWLCSM